MADKQIFNDDEKTIELLDKLVSIQYPDEYGTIHRVTPDSEVFRIVPKDSPFGPGKDRCRYAASVKEAFEILRNNRSYELRWYTGPCESVREIKLKWMVLDALGLPYIKLGGDLAAIHWATKEHLLYNGNNEAHAEEYHFANVVLGSEEPNENLKWRLGANYKEEIEDFRWVAEHRQKEI